MNRRGFLLLLAAAGVSPARAADFSDAAVRRFIADMQARHQFDADELSRFFAQLTMNPRVLELIESPRKKRVYWRQYRRRHVTPALTVRGAKFIEAHRDAFSRAEAQYGVPPPVVAAILGVETRYGGYLGNFRVAESLATLAFAYPRRGDEFRRELEEFLIYARQARINPLQLRGSFAGAFGMPQFLPGSARRFAVDFDGDGRTNLFVAADAIGSIANFLAQHGWRRGGDISRAVSFSGDVAELIAQTEKNNFKPSLSAADFAAAGATPAVAADRDGRYLLVDLHNRFDTEYRVGGENFYAITRYNKSFKYASAVADLARAIQLQL